MINNANKWREFWLRRNHVDPGFLPLAILFYFVFVLLLFGWLQSRHKIYIIIVLERKGERGRESALFKKKKKKFRRGAKKWHHAMMGVECCAVPERAVYSSLCSRRRKGEKKKKTENRQGKGVVIWFERHQSVQGLVCVHCIYVYTRFFSVIISFNLSLSLFFSFSPLALIFDVLHIA